MIRVKQRAATMNKGYFGIGVYHPKTAENIGTLWRHANNFGADFIFTIGHRYRKQASDTSATWRNIPLYHYADFTDFRRHIPYDCPLVCVELAPNSTTLPRFEHPQRCIYLLGAEDHGLSENVLSAAQHIVEIPTGIPQSMNVAVSGTLVMYDRYTKAGLAA
jgi:tRNA G18 (ribose-2'-O)-methylase SpoU